MIKEYICINMIKEYIILQVHSICTVKMLEVYQNIINLLFVSKPFPQETPRLYGTNILVEPIHQWP